MTTIIFYQRIIGLRVQRTITRLDVISYVFL